MAQVWNGAWLTVAFLSELAALAALGAWGFGTAGGVVRVLLGLGLPITAAVLWGLFAAPRAPVQIAAVTVLVMVAVYGAAAAALLSLGHPRLAAALVVAAVLGSALSTAPSSPEGAPLTAPAVRLPG